MVGDEAAVVMVDLPRISGVRCAAAAGLHQLGVGPTPAGSVTATEIADAHHRDAATRSPRRSDPEVRFRAPPCWRVYLRGTTVVWASPVARHPDWYVATDPSTAVRLIGW